MWNVDARPTPGQTKVVDYLIALGAVVAAALGVHMTSAYFLPMPTPGPVSLFFCAVLLGAWRGAGPGGLAFLLSLLSLCFFFGHSGIGHFTSRDEVRLAYFSLVGIGIVLLGAAKSRALTAAWSANADLAQAVLRLRYTNQKLESDGAERERIYKKLHLSQTLLAEGQRITNTGSWLLNVKTSKLIWSDEHYRLFGYTPDIGEPTFQMASQRIHTEDRGRVGALVHEATRNCARFDCEYRIVLPGGEIRHIQAAGYPACEARAGSGEYIGISVDITERREAEQALRRSEREFRALAENSPDCVVRYDLDCRRVYINPAYERTRGVAAGDMLHRPLEEDWHWDKPVARFEARLRRIIETGEPDQMFGIWHSPGGQPIHCAVKAVAERDASGHVVSVLAIIGDVTSLKQAEVRLEQSQNLLRQLANRSETVREEERKHLARELHDDLAQYLLALRMKIAMLDFEFGQRQPSLAPKTAAMIALLDSSIAVVRNTITSPASGGAGHGHCLGARMAGAAIHRADRHRFAPRQRRQDHTPQRGAGRGVFPHRAGGPQERGETRRRDAGGHRPARQGRRLPAGSQGQRRRLRRHAGQARFVRAGRDARARVDVGRHGRHRHGARLRHHDPRPDSHPCDGAGSMIRILLVDDHALMREGLKQLFALVDGVDVVAEAANGAQAIDALRRTEVDLILLDMSMPGISGPNLINHLRSKENCPPVLVLSTHSELQVARRALGAGAAGYLTKDNDPQTLISAVLRVAGGGRFIDPRLAEQMAFEVDNSAQRAPHESLSDREFEIFNLLARGRSVNDIAEELVISNKTVSTHKARLMQKMNFFNNAELVRYAVAHNLVD
jgi:PAS domain S-box-containing protein